jgi:hypothetical protein
MSNSGPFVTNKYAYEVEVKGVLAKMSRVTQMIEQQNKDEPRLNRIKEDLD